MEHKNMNFTHFMYVPFTGLGLYGGYRGSTWLRNRINIFKKYTFESLKNQTNRNFTLWISWRPQERTNKQVIELDKWLSKNAPFDHVFTYSGVCFWDDKYKDEEAHDRLADAIRGAWELISLAKDTVIMTIQPSDDCYKNDAVQEIQDTLLNTSAEATGYRKGYITYYQTGEMREYNPTTIPPFFSIKFDKKVFIEPIKHIKYTGPYKSHEYVGDKLKFVDLPGRGFLVGTHGENISTVFDHVFTKRDIVGEERLEVLKTFGVSGTLKLPPNFRRWLMRKLPYRVRRKLRYLLGECFYAKIHNFLKKSL